MRGALLLLPLLALGCALSPALRRQADSDLEWGRSLRGAEASPLHRKLFGDSPLDGRLYEAFFKQRVTRLAKAGTFTGCAGAIACHGAWKTVRLTEKYADPRLPQVVRLSLLLHEARHSDDGSHDHFVCPGSIRGPDGGPLRSPYLDVEVGGLRACDEEPLGAYGLQIVMLRNIQRYCGNCEPAVKTEAGRYADFLMNLIRSEEARRELLAD